jgi:dihydroorotate dehydrogenase
VQKNLTRIPLPLLLKISPDENFKTLEFIISSAQENGFSGVIATNTSISRFKNKHFESFESGGLSGNPLEDKSNEIINFIAKLTDYKFPIIGVGGISVSKFCYAKNGRWCCFITNLLII